MQAFRTAAPFRSAPEDAAVAEVLGTLSVAVAISLIRSRRKPQFAHGDAHHLGVEPLPHLGASMVHLGGAVHVKEHEGARLVVMGERERDPELERGHGEPALDPLVCSCSTRPQPRAWRRSQPAPAPGSRPSEGGCRRCPGGNASCWSRRCRGRGCGSRTTSGGRPRRREIRSTISSMTSMPCGPPKPRNAVFEATFVLAIRPVNRTAGM